MAYLCIDDLIAGKDANRASLKSYFLNQNKDTLQQYCTSILVMWLFSIVMSNKPYIIKHQANCYFVYNKGARGLSNQTIAKDYLLYKKPGWMKVIAG